MSISDNMVAVIVLGLAMMVPMVAVLAKHQLRMATLFRSQPNAVDNEAIMRLSAEVQDLRALVTQQAIALDNLSESHRRVLASIQADSLPNLQQR